MNELGRGSSILGVSPHDASSSGMLIEVNPFQPYLTLPYHHPRCSPVFLCSLRPLATALSPSTTYPSVSLHCAKHLVHILICR